MKRALPAFLLLIVAVAPCYSQDSSTSHVFPQFGDGRLGDGTSYKSTIMIRALDTAQLVTICFLELNGMSAQLETGVSGSIFQLNLPPGGFSITRTTGVQGFQAGYATLDCSDLVFAQVLFSFYAANGTKLGEATVFSSTPRPINSTLFDTRENARFAIAVANTTATTRAYNVFVSGNFPTLLATFNVGPRVNRALFLDELVTLPANAIGLVRIRSADLSNAVAIGFRYSSGGLFTTVPAN